MIRGLYYPGEQMHQAGRKTTPPVWTPRQGGSLLGWWGATKLPTVPLTTPLMQSVYAPDHQDDHPVWPDQWSQLMRRNRSVLTTVTVGATTQLFKAGRRHTQQTLRRPFRDHQQNWLTTLTQLSPTPWVTRGVHPRVNPFYGTPTLLTNRRQRLATNWLPRTPFFQQKKVVPISVTPRYTRVGGLRLSFPRFRHLHRRRRRWTSTVTVSASPLQWKAKSLIMWVNLSLSRRVARQKRAPSRWLGHRIRFFTPTTQHRRGVFDLPPPNLYHRHLPRLRSRRQRRRRRWLPGESYWLFREYFRHVSPRSPQRWGYLGLPISLPLIGYPAPPGRQRVMPTVVPSYLPTTTGAGVWRRRRWRRRLPRPRRRGLRLPGVVLRYGRSGGPHQQRGATRADWATPLRRLASLLVRRGQRWHTEPVWRHAGRQVGWTTLYWTGYTSVGYRSRIRAGTAVKVPSLLSPAKSVVFFRRWFTHAVAHHPARHWADRVTTTAAAPTALVKQQQEFITTALVNAALL